MVESVKQNNLSKCLKSSYDIEREAQKTPNRLLTGSQTGSRNSEYKTADQRLAEDDCENEDEMIELIENLDKYFDEILLELFDNTNFAENTALLVVGDEFVLNVPIEGISKLEKFQISRDFSLSTHFNRINIHGKDSNMPKAKIFAFGSDDSDENHQKISQHVTQFKTGWKISKPKSNSEFSEIFSSSNGIISISNLRFPAFLTSRDIARSDYTANQLAIILDKTPSPSSFVFQNKLSTLRNPSELKSEKYLEFIGLLTMAGVGSIVSNQFYSKNNINHFKLQQLTIAAVNDKKSIAEAVQAVRLNILPDVPPDSAMGKKGKKTDGKGKGKNENEKMRIKLDLNEKLSTTLFGLPNTFIN